MKNMEKEEANFGAKEEGKGDKKGEKMEEEVPSPPKK